MLRIRIIRTATVAVFLIYLLQVFSPLRLVGDGIDYLLQASSAADGLGFYVHGQKSMRPSGYPLLIVGLIKIGIGKSWAIVALNCLGVAIGCIAIYLISRNTFALTAEGSYVVSLLTMLSFVVVRQAAQPLSDICFFGLSTTCLLLILRAEEHNARKSLLLSLAGVLLIFCIELRTIGIALIPPLLWVLLGGMPTFQKIPTWVRNRRALSFTALLLALAGMVLLSADLLHSRYFQFNKPVFVHRGIVRGLLANLGDHSREWGEITINLPASKLPRELAIPVQCVGLLALLVFSVSLWTQRKRFTTMFLYMFCFSCIVLVYPWYDSRLWLPIIPFLFIYLFVGVRDSVNVNARRALVAIWCIIYGLFGLAALAYSTRLTFLSPEHFANTYGDGNLRSAYRLVYRLSTPNNVEIDKDAVYLLLRYGANQ